MQLQSLKVTLYLVPKKLQFFFLKEFNIQFQIALDIKFLKTEKLLFSWDNLSFNNGLYARINSRQYASQTERQIKAKPWTTDWRHKNTHRCFHRENEGWLNGLIIIWEWDDLFDEAK